MGTAVLNARHGLSSGSWSFGSRNPSSQRPKVSVGITVDRTPEVGPQARKIDANALPTGTNALGVQGEITHYSRRHEANSSRKTEEKQVVEPEHTRHGVWISTHSIQHVKAASKFPSQKSGIHSDKKANKESGSLTCEKSKQKSENIQKVEEVACATGQENDVPDKRSVENTGATTKTDNESLKQKLWEILGPGLSQKNQISGRQVPEHKTDPPPGEICDKQSAEHPKVHQNSDTIESDSEDIDKAVRRPVTRSLTRTLPKKSLPNTIQQSRSARNQISSVPKTKEKLAGTNVFNFNEKIETTEGTSFPAKSTLSRRTKKRFSRNSLKVEPRRISFPRRSISGKTSESSDKEHTLPAGDDASVKGNHLGQASCSPCEIKTNVWHQSSAIPQRKYQNLEAGHKNNFNVPPVEKCEAIHENVSNPQNNMFSANSTVKQSLEAFTPMPQKTYIESFSRKPQLSGSPQSPLLARGTSPSFRDKSNAHDVQMDEGSGAEKPVASHSTSSPRLGSSASDASEETSDHVRYSSVSPIKFCKPLTHDDFIQEHFQPSRKESDSDSIEAHEDANQGGGRAEKWFSDARTEKASPIPFHHSKRLRSLDDTNMRSMQQPSTSQSGDSRTEESKESIEDAEQLPDDSLGRSISQLALVLEKFKAKIRSHTCKKNSEILSSVRERVHTHLQNVESEIQADVMKFTSIAKSKRKRLESTFQGHQEKLKLIHEKFKEEINHHLADCRVTLEELESFQLEMKANVEWQRASHRKLLMQVEESMKVQLGDAETSISAVHEAARKRMNDLKHALREWLSDGPLS